MCALTNALTTSLLVKTQSTDIAKNNLISRIPFKSPSKFGTFYACILFKVCLDWPGTNINASQAEEVESNDRMHLES